MIIRILGEGQYELADRHLAAVNVLDEALEATMDGGDERAFTAALRALLDAVRALGVPLPADRLVPSGLVLPDEEMSVEQVRALLSEDGLIPG